MRFLNASEAIKRLAAAQGIDILNLVKTEEEMAQEAQQAQQQQMQASLMDQAGQLANSPMADPTKNNTLASMTQPLPSEEPEQPPQE